MISEEKDNDDGGAGGGWYQFGTYVCADWNEMSCKSGRSLEFSFSSPTKSLSTSTIIKSCQISLSLSAKEGVDPRVNLYLLGQN